MKQKPFPVLIGILPFLGLGGCGALTGDGLPEVTNAKRLNVAMAAEAAGDNQMALQIYATALAKDPTDTEAAVRYARALVTARQVGLARELLSRQLAANPGHPGLSREFGTIEVMQGQPQPALARFDVALQANPRDVRALVNKGIALDMLGQHAEAQGLYRQADTLSPDDAAVRSNLAMSLMLHGRVQEAGQVLQNLPGGANSPRLRNNMALVAAANGDMARARQLTAGEVSEAELQALASRLRGGAEPEGAALSAVPEPVKPAEVTKATAGGRRDRKVSASVVAPERVEPAVVVMPVETQALPPVPQVARSATVETAAPPPAVAAPAATVAGEGALPLTVPSPVGMPAAPSRSQMPSLPAGTRVGGELDDKLKAELPQIPEDKVESVAASAVAPTAPEPAGVPAVAADLAASPARLGYSVQLAVVGSEAAAQVERRMLNGRLPLLLNGRELAVEPRKLDSGRTVWRLRVPGFAGQGDARRFCDEVKLGGRDCFVVGGTPAAAPRMAVASEMPAGAGPISLVVPPPAG